MGVQGCHQRDRRREAAGLVSRARGAIPNAPERSRTLAIARVRARTLPYAPVRHVRSSSLPNAPVRSILLPCDQFSPVRSWWLPCDLVCPCAIPQTLLGVDQPQVQPSAACQRPLRPPLRALHDHDGPHGADWSHAVPPLVSSVPLSVGLGPKRSHAVPPPAPHPFGRRRSQAAVASVS